METYNIITDNQRLQTQNDIKTVKAAVIVHLFYEEQVEYSQGYLKQVPDSIDIVIISPKEEILNQFSDKRYITIKKENRGRDISALLVAAKTIIFRYKYICFVHDKKEKRLDDNEYVEYVNLWRKNMWDNMLQSTMYIYNILDLFEDDHKLGMLVPLPPHRGDRGAWLKGCWGDTFELVRGLADKIGIEADICHENPPFTYSTVFWARTSVLKKLFSMDWTYTNFPNEPMKDCGEINHAVERIFQYVVEDAGYETRVVLSSTFASSFILQLKGEMNRMWDWAWTAFGIENYSEMDLYNSRIERVKEFEKKYLHIYLYGAGKAGKDCLRICSVLDIKPAGVLVTDIMGVHNSMGELPILAITEFTSIHNSGIIICAYKNTFREEMKKELEKKGICEYMMF